MTQSTHAMLYLPWFGDPKIGSSPFGDSVIRLPLCKDVFERDDSSLDRAPRISSRIARPSFTSHVGARVLYLCDITRSGRNRTICGKRMRMPSPTSWHSMNGKHPLTMSK